MSLDQGNIANSLGVVMRVPGAFVMNMTLDPVKNKELDISPLWWTWTFTMCDSPRCALSRNQMLAILWLPVLGPIMAPEPRQKARIIYSRDSDLWVLDITWNRSNQSLRQTKICTRCRLGVFGSRLVQCNNLKLPANDAEKKNTAKL